MPTIGRRREYFVRPLWFGPGVAVAAGMIRHPPAAREGASPEHDVDDIGMLGQNRRKASMAYSIPLFGDSRRR